MFWAGDSGKFLEISLGDSDSWFCDSTNKACLKSLLHLIFKIVIKRNFRYFMITGWGRTATGSPSDVLQVATIPVQNNFVCNILNGYITHVHDGAMLCAGGQGQAGGCHGDSGGPFVCLEGGSYILRGIVSWGQPHCRTDHVSVFTRVSSYMNWILPKIAGSFSSSFIFIYYLFIYLIFLCNTLLLKDPFWDYQ